jgi:hypothetical protein
VKPPQPVQPKEQPAPPAAVRGLSAGADGRARVPVAHMIEPSILRLEEVIDQETEALRSRKSVDLKGFSERKNQALLELTRLMRHVQGGAGNPQLMERMAKVRAKLEINRALLKMHFEAVREIAEALSDAIRDAESDGTYSHTILANSRQQ